MHLSCWSERTVIQIYNSVKANMIETTETNDKAIWESCGDRSRFIEALITNSPVDKRLFFEYFDFSGCFHAININNTNIKVITLVDFLDDKFKLQPYMMKEYDGLLFSELPTPQQRRIKEYYFNLWNFDSRELDSDFQMHFEHMVGL